MDRKDLWPESRASATSGERLEKPEQSGGNGFPAGTAEALMERARRAQLIEDIAYKLTDLITIISGRVELLSERVPSVHVKDLQEIRQTASANCFCGRCRRAGRRWGFKSSCSGDPTTWESGTD
jgi:hypothetical protein